MEGSIEAVGHRQVSFKGVNSPELPVIQTRSFRHRGFSFRHRAGTNRMHLAQYMWRYQRDWVRYGTSRMTQLFPVLAPKPLPSSSNTYAYSPNIPDADDFSFVVVGDTGMNSPGQYLVSTALSRQDIYPSDFCMILGDVMYPAGGEESYQYGLLEAFKYYGKPILALPGNHDWYDNLRAFRKFFVQGGRPGQLGQQYRWHSPQLPNWYYYMDFGSSLRIITLDTGLCGQMGFHRQAQLKWLDVLLETAGHRKVILMMHHPLVSLRQRGHEAGLQSLLKTRLNKANVVAVFSGHDHSYQRHEVEGQQHIIQGAGGATLHPLPQSRTIALPDGSQQTLTARPDWDRKFSFTRCRWKNGQLTCTTFSAHELPGRVIDRVVL